MRAEHGAPRTVPATPRVNVTWSLDRDVNARLRTILETLGMVEVNRDETASLFAPGPRPPVTPPVKGLRRLSAKG